MGEPSHDILPLRTVSRLTGLTEDVIRVWEKRYGVVSPEALSRTRPDVSDRSRVAHPHSGRDAPMSIGAVSIPEGAF